MDGQSVMICANCGTRGFPKTYSRGNTYIKVMTWPLSTLGNYKGCPRCAAPNMLPLDSPRGLELARTYPEPVAGPVTLEAGDEIYYSEGWYVRTAKGSVLGPFWSKEKAERADRASVPGQN